jgi:hypothetical protein
MLGIGGPVSRCGVFSLHRVEALEGYVITVILGAAS